jgi:hypothetical protein
MEGLVTVVDASQNTITVVTDFYSGNIGDLFTGWKITLTGRSGAVGFTGATGVGATGASGPSGYIGATGPTGPTGAGGLAGATGPTGTGATGASGIWGSTGASGYTGATGSSGPSGYTGATGASGPSGYTGATGASGIGSVGATGASGIGGATGASGAGYIQGATGAVTIVSSGNVDFFGLTQTSSAFTLGTRTRAASNSTPSNYMEGVISYIGNRITLNVDSAAGVGQTFNDWTFSVVGQAGSKGYTGATGASGIGSVGATGASGFSGYTGATGASGIGSVGATGASGYNGTNGATGSSGPSGYTGATGSSGIGSVGATGASGFSGYTGATGSSGIGSVGATGASGAGATGASGPSGYIGATGASGAQGPLGATGTFDSFSNASAYAAVSQSGSIVDPCFVYATPGEKYIDNVFLSVNALVLFGKQTILTENGLWQVFESGITEALSGAGTVGSTTLRINSFITGTNFQVGAFIKIGNSATVYRIVAAPSPGPTGDYTLNQALTGNVTSSTSVKTFCSLVRPANYSAGTTVKAPVMVAISKGSNYNGYFYNIYNSNPKSLGATGSTGSIPSSDGTIVPNTDAVGVGTILVRGGISGGATGASGVGATGATGIGATGATGASGPSGYTGATGASGAGATGASGPSGYTGATGASGPSGDTGATGASGIGSVGATGASGPSGYTGATGPTGPTGAGATGASGLQGATGPYNNPTTRAVTTTTDTLVIGDQNNAVSYSVACAVTLGAANWPVGTQIVLINLGTGIVTVSLTAANNTTVYAAGSKNKMSTQYATAVLHCYLVSGNASYWILSGDLTA